jgi:hypothetical protein
MELELCQAKVAEKDPDVGDGKNKRKRRLVNHLNQESVPKRQRQDNENKALEAAKRVPVQPQRLLKTPPRRSENTQMAECLP